MSTFGTRLKNERNRLGMTQAELAAIGGVQKNAQSLYEKDANPVSSDYLANVAKVGVDIHFLFYGEYSAKSVSGHFQDLLKALLGLSPEQQAIGFGMLSMLQTDVASAEPDTRRADAIWRAVRLYNQFLAMDEKERSMVELAATIGDYRSDK